MYQALSRFSVLQATESWAGAWERGYPTCAGGDDSCSGGLRENEAVTDISHPYLDSRCGGKEARKTSCKLLVPHGLLCGRASNLGGKRGEEEREERSKERREGKRGEEERW